MQLHIISEVLLSVLIKKRIHIYHENVLGTLNCSINLQPINI